MLVQSDEFAGAQADFGWHWQWTNQIQVYEMKSETTTSLPVCDATCLNGASAGLKRNALDEDSSFLQSLRDGRTKGLAVSVAPPDVGESRRENHPVRRRSACAAICALRLSTNSFREQEIHLVYP